MTLPSVISSVSEDVDPDNPPATTSAAQPHCQVCDALSAIGNVTPAPTATTPGPELVKPPAPPSGHYNFSGNSFNLSVTRNGRAPPPGLPPPTVAPNGVPERPGFIQRLFNWW